MGHDRVASLAKVSTLAAECALSWPISSVLKAYELTGQDTSSENEKPRYRGVLLDIVDHALGVVAPLIRRSRTAGSSGLSSRT